METVTGPGRLTFWWKVSSEATHDYLEFYINGVLQSGRISGEVDWQEIAFDLAGGSKVLRWRYFKDGAANAGQDRGWVDELQFVGPTVTPKVTALSSGNDLTLTWPDSATGYRVESALSLSPPTSWSNVAGSFQTNGGSISIVLPITGGQKFYRLVKP